MNYQQCFNCKIENYWKWVSVLHVLIFQKQTKMFPKLFTFSCCTNKVSKNDPITLWISVAVTSLLVLLERPQVSLTKQGLTPNMSRTLSPWCCVEFCFTRPARSQQGNRIRYSTDCVNWQYEKPVKALTSARSSSFSLLLQNIVYDHKYPYYKA